MFKQLGVAAPDSKEVSRMLIAAVDRDLEIAGYYRKDQSLDICIEVEDSTLLIVLRFKATLIPIRKGAPVFHPRIDAPDGVKLRDSPRVDALNLSIS
jgi:hypothetical protein